MNFVFDADTLREIPNSDLQSTANCENEPLSKNNRSSTSPKLSTMVKIRHVQKKNIVGPHIRSKFGCTCCKKDRKKCDERRPKCGKCIDKSRECVYLLPESKAKCVSRANGNETQALSAIGEISGVNSAPVPNTGGNNIETSPLDTSSLEISPTFSRCETLTTRASSTMLSSPLPDLSPDFYDQLEEFLNAHPGSTFVDHQASRASILPTSFQLPNSPNSVLSSSIYALYLDEKGLKYLQYFQTNVSKLLCLTSAYSPNYFVNTFFSVAIYDEAILNALAAWGGYFMESLVSPGNSLKLDSLEVDQLFLSYMEKAKSIISKRYANDPLDKNDRYTLLCFYIIEMGMKICTGDVSDWYKIFTKSHKMLNTNYGGILQLCEDFSYSNDVKWLVLNLQYHDIMSSVTQSKGTLFSMEDYNTLFTQYKILDSGGYGLDPFQGIIQPIYLLLGEIMNAHVTLKSWRSKIEKQISGFEDVSKGSVETRYLRQMRIVYFEDAESTYDRLKERVITCEPSSVQVDLLSRTGKSTLQHHLKLFEIVRNTCKLYMLLHLKQVTPASPEVQLILLQSLVYIESIEDTNIVAALPMLLLICGIACSLPCDRKEMHGTFKKIYSTYKVGNLARVWDVVEEYWRRNPMGTLCIDWADICEENGWSLCMC